MRRLIFVVVFFRASAAPSRGNDSRFLSIRNIVNIRKVFAVGPLCQVNVLYQPAKEPFKARRSNGIHHLLSKRTVREPSTEMLRLTWEEHPTIEVFGGLTFSKLRWHGKFLEILRYCKYRPNAEYAPWSSAVIDNIKFKLRVFADG